MEPADVDAVGKAGPAARLRGRESDLAEAAREEREALLLAGGLDDVYERLDLAIYSPLCLALGFDTAPLLVATRSRVDQTATTLTVSAMTRISR